jgi:hypothetical protein
LAKNAVQLFYAVGLANAVLAGGRFTIAETRGARVQKRAPFSQRGDANIGQFDD